MCKCIPLIAVKKIKKNKKIRIELIVFTNFIAMPISPNRLCPTANSIGILIGTRCLSQFCQHFWLPAGIPQRCKKVLGKKQG
jgi:hypothetical protein